MNRLSARVALVLLGLFLFPYRSPAPLVYRPGEGWSYEMAGSKNDWHRLLAKDQLEVSLQAFNKKQYRLALKSSLRVVKVWPYSDSAPQAQYLIGRCYEARKMDEKAFKAYQIMLDDPTFQRVRASAPPNLITSQTLPENFKVANTDEVQNRQFTIAVRFLHGQWFKLWGYIPFFPSMDKTADMFEKIVRYGPYGPLGPPSQMNIGAAREKEKDYSAAVKAYERAADRYSDQTKIAAEAQYKEAMAYDKQARKAEYDQSIAGQAIATFTDFMALYPDDPRVTDARQIITSLKAEEARGNFKIAQYYEKQKKWDGALIYYNEVLIADAGSPLANQARQRIDILKRRPPPPPINQAAPVSTHPWTVPTTPNSPANPDLPATPPK